jgi:hypothetical protein
MARRTETNEVYQLIRLFMVFESSEGDNVVNIKVSAQFLFVYTAMATFVIVSLAGVATLGVPIFTIITFFVGNVLSVIVASVPCVVTLWRAKEMVALGIRYGKRLLALFAWASKSLLCLSLPHANVRAITLFFVGSVSVLEECSAMIASAFNRAIAKAYTLFSGVGALLTTIAAIAAIFILGLFTAMLTSERFESHKKHLLLMVDPMLVEGIRSLTEGMINNNSSPDSSQQIYALDNFIIHETKAIA